VSAASLRSLDGCIKVWDLQEGHIGTEVQSVRMPYGVAGLHCLGDSVLVGTTGGTAYLCASLAAACACACAVGPATRAPPAQHAQTRSAAGSPHSASSPGEAAAVLSALSRAARVRVQAAADRRRRHRAQR